MKIEEQVVSLELAKELKEAGYKQEGVWWWVNHFGHYSINIHKEGAICVAPTVAELGEALPHCCMSYKKKEHWVCTYGEPYPTDKNKFIHADTEANARAKLWLYLKKENHEV